MFAARQIANQNLGVHQVGIIDCERCRSPIQIRQPNMVSVEFSVPCPKCGHRGMYFKRMIHNGEPVERRKTPRK